MVTNLSGTGLNTCPGGPAGEALDPQYLHGQTHIYRVALNKSGRNSEQLHHELSSYHFCYYPACMPPDGRTDASSMRRCEPATKRRQTRGQGKLWQAVPGDMLLRSVVGRSSRVCSVVRRPVNGLAVAGYHLYTYPYSLHACRLQDRTCRARHRTGAGQQKKSCRGFTAGL